MIQLFSCSFVSFFPHASFTEAPEQPTSLWRDIFRHGFGTLALFLAWGSFTMIVLWIEHDQMGGGLGKRPTDGIAPTAQYFNWHPFLMVSAFLLIMTPGK